MVPFSWNLICVVAIFTVWTNESVAYDRNNNEDYDLFPNIAAYDPLIIDPYHIHGSPYGGFSRSVQSKLASLPLHLPEILETESTPSIPHDPMYFEIRDEYGRLFACRQYFEDELEQSSLYGSMFSVPILRETLDIQEISSKNDQNTNKKNEIDTDDKVKTIHTSDQTIPHESSVSHQSTDQHEISTSATTDEEIGTFDAVGTEVSNNPDQPVDGSASKKVPTKPMISQVNMLMTSIEIDKRLHELESICGQLHKGWWSYEWCYRETITQFHLEYEAETNMIHVESMLNLGHYKGRKILLDVDGLPPNELSEGSSELARVTDIYEGGNVCDETGAARITHVNMICCSETIAKRLNGMLHKQGHPVTTNVAVFVDIEEDDETLCLYNATVCTPLLCGNLDMGDSENESGKPEYRVISKSSPLEKDLAVGKENESIREILDRVLSMLCLQSNLGGWWTYEICYKNQIRQFHEAIGTKRNNLGTKVLTKVTEAEHILGVYDASNERIDIPDEEEWKLVVNVTKSGGSSSAGSSFWGEGSGAYYEIEYTGGDVCDHTDVTDSAIVAGSSKSATRGLERSSTVRYFCGETYDIEVHEDSTCHYIVQVKVPALCQHRLFRAPTAKKQVIKCLPVDDL